MFGRHPRLPIDIEYGVTQLNLTSSGLKNYVKKLKTCLQHAYEKVLQCNQKESRRQKKYYDQKHRCMKLAPNDIVLVQVKAFGVNHKVADKWKQTPYLALSQLGDQPIYKVKEIDSEGEENVKVLHRNMLYPLLSYNREIVNNTVLVAANALMDLYFS